MAIGVIITQNFILVSLVAVIFFAQEITQLAGEVKQKISELSQHQSEGVMNIYGGTGYQSIKNQGQTFQGGSHKIQINHNQMKDQSDNEK